MTSDNIEDKYPSWRDALFGNNDAVANLRCAVHYVFWHSVYALIALAGVVVIGVLNVVRLFSRALGPLGGPVRSGIDRVRSTVSAIANHKHAENAAGAFIVIAVVASGLYLLGVFLLFLYTQFWLTMGAIAITLGVVAAIIATVAIGEFLLPHAKSASSVAAQKTRSAGEKAVQTPGIRRVYGQCPVSMEQCPRWFDNLFPEEIDD